MVSLRSRLYAVFLVSLIILYLSVWDGTQLTIMKHGIADIILFTSGASLVFIYVDRKIVQRILRINKQTSSVDASGDHIKRVAVNKHDEIENIVSYMNVVTEDLITKNQEIKAIMDYFHIAIFSISDRVNLELDSIRSKNLTTILLAKPNVPYNINSLLLDHSSLTDDQKKSITTCLKESIGEHVTTFSLNLEILPKELVLTFENHERRFVALDWSAVLRPDGSERVLKILVGCRDVTLLKEIQILEKSRAKDLKMISEIIRIPHFRFGLFRDTSVRYLDEITNVMLINNNNLEHCMKIALINLHTVKSSAATLGLTELIQKLHYAEDIVSVWLHGKGGVGDRERVAVEVDLIRSTILEYQTISKVILNRNDSDNNKIDLDRRFAIQIIRRIKNKQSLEECQIKTLIESAFIPMCRLVDEAKTSLPRLAKDLGKPAPDIYVSGAEGLYLTLDAFSALVPAFIHIMRNSMDHGIESDEVRTAKGKKYNGSFSLHFNLEEEKLEIRVFDDGRGLHLYMIREIGSMRGLIPEDTEYTPEELASLILSDGFSTVNSVTEISGRGMGLTATRELLIGFDGSIEIVFTEKPVNGFVKFEFLITVPRSHVVCLK